MALSVLEACAPAAAADCDEKERALLRAVAEHRDRAAFAELFERCKRAAFSLAFQISGDRASAEDAVQDSMLQVWTCARHFRMDGPVRAWILRIVARQSLKIVQHRRITKERIVRRQNALPAAGNAAEAAPEERERLEALRGLLAELPEKHRQLLALYFGAELSQQEIGRHLNVPRSTVSRRIQEIVDGLRGHLARAGLASTAPLGAEELRALVLDAETPPGGLFESIAGKLAKAGGPASARSAAAKPYWKLVWGAVSVLACAAAVGWHMSRETKEAFSLPIVRPAESKTQPAKGPAESNTYEPTRHANLSLPIAWDLDATTLPGEFKPLSGRMRFAQDPIQGGRAFWFPGPEIGHFMVTTPLPERPVIVEAKIRPNSTEVISFALAFCDGQTLAPSQTRKWQEIHEFHFSRTLTVRWYVFGNRSVLENNGKVQSGCLTLRGPKDRWLVFSGKRCGIRTIEILPLSESDLPPKVQAAFQRLDDAQLSPPQKREPLPANKP